MNNFSPIVQTLIAQVKALGIRGTIVVLDDKSIKIVLVKRNIGYYTIIEYNERTDLYDVIKTRLNLNSWQDSEDGIFEDVYAEQLQELAWK